jgi:hypothetical protein
MYSQRRNPLRQGHRETVHLVSLAQPAYGSLAHMEVSHSPRRESNGVPSLAPRAKPQPFQHPNRRSIGDISAGSNDGNGL